MTQRVCRVGAEDPIRAAAEVMAADDVGDVVVVKGWRAYGIVTDRDIVVRAVAQGLDVSTTPVWEIASAELTVVADDTPIDEAARLMREKALRRLVVVNEARKLVGLVSLGDLEVERQPTSALAAITRAPPNR